ncbi:MAG: hypothetical protein AAF677_12885 [Pseudomonadota bacterium]
MGADDRIDARDDRALADSVRRLSDAMGGAERGVFGAGIAALLMEAARAGASPHAALDGLSVAEIMAAGRAAIAARAARATEVPAAGSTDGLAQGPADADADAEGGVTARADGRGATAGGGDARNGDAATARAGAGSPRAQVETPAGAAQGSADDAGGAAAPTAVEAASADDLVDAERVALLACLRRRVAFEDVALLAMRGGGTALRFTVVNGLDYPLAGLRFAVLASAAESGVALVVQRFTMPLSGGLAPGARRQVGGRLSRETLVGDPATGAGGAAGARTGRVAVALTLMDVADAERVPQLAAWDAVARSAPMPRPCAP